MIRNRLVFFLIISYVIMGTLFAEFQRFNTGAQKESFSLISQDVCSQMELSFKTESLNGVWGVVFNYKNNKNFSVLNYYPHLNKVYYYRCLRGGFKEVAKVQASISSDMTLTLSQKNNLIELSWNGQSFCFDEPYLNGGKVGFRSESYAASFLAELKPLKTHVNYEAAFNEEKYMRDYYFDKENKMMLFYDFKDPIEDFHFCQIRGETTCEWKDGKLHFSFPDAFDTWMTFHKDVSGYQGYMLQGSFSCPGTAKIELIDIFDKVFRFEMELSPEDTEMNIPFDKLSSDSGYKLSTMETMKLKFFPSDGSKNNAFALTKMEPYGPDPMRGPWTAVDPLFAYYKFSPWQRTAKVLKNNGFLGAEIISIKDEPVAEEQVKMVKAFHDEGLISILRVYPTTDFNAFHDHPEWRQITLDGSSEFDWRVYLCPNSEAFTNYICDKVYQLISKVPYDAIELSEPWFEIWGGPYPENDRHGKYACLCENCRSKFKAISGVDPLDLFKQDGPKYFQKPENQELYEQWMTFRVDSNIIFSKKLYAAAKKARPGIKIVHMHLSDCTVEPGKIREYQAQDFEKAIIDIQPDAIIIEDAWQDWEKPDTPPSFVRAYGKYYLERMRKAKPDIIVLGHADIGSIAQMQRSYSWMREFSANAQQIGFDGVDYYEFTLGDFSR